MHIHLIQKLNHRRIHLTSVFQGHTVPIRLKSGGFQPVDFVGFANLYDARASKAKPVLIQVDSIESDADDLRTLKEGEYIHGALTRLGVYAVLVQGYPKIVTEYDRPLPPNLLA